MLKRMLAGLAAIALALVVFPASAEAQAMKAPKYENVTITGTVVDVSCKFGQGLSGPDHKMCTEICADKGIPLAILSENGQLYIPTTSAMPGESQNDVLKPFSEEMVTVTGKAFAAGGANVIQISEIKAKS